MRNGAGRGDRGFRRGAVRTSEHFDVTVEGAALYVRDWIPDGGAKRGVYLLHGLGEHVGRYDALARWFCARGWRVRAHDHIGHGRSAGRRGVIAAPGQLGDHARALFEAFRAELGAAPLLLGHSMGGALAAEMVVCMRVPAAGLVLSSPALDPGLGLAQRALAALLDGLAPELTVGNGLDPEALSHDPAVVRSYRNDPLVHDRVSARLVRWLVDAGARATQAASGLRVPTLMLVAGSDRLVDARGTWEFARRVPVSGLRLHWYHRLHHELFNEREADRAVVLSDLDAWLTALLAGWLR